MSLKTKGRRQGDPRMEKNAGHFITWRSRSIILKHYIINVRKINQTARNQPTSKYQSIQNQNQQDCNKFLCLRTVLIVLLQIFFGIILS